MHPKPAQDNKIQLEPDAAQTTDNSARRNLQSTNLQAQQNLKKTKNKSAIDSQLHKQNNGSFATTNNEKSQKGLQSHLVGRTLSSFGRKRDRLFRNLKYGSETEARPLAGDVALSTLHLFRYATWRERSAVLVGIAFMWYAASWQPISVFILATMAALMGHYSKRTSWSLDQLNKSTTPEHVNWMVLPWFTNSSRDRDLLLSDSNPVEPPPSHLSETPEQVASSYDKFNLMGPLQSSLGHLFDLGDRNGAATQDNATTTTMAEKAAALLDRESHEFLRESFEINGCAFLLALTQLLAFFLGLSLITWAARRQASHIKLLYYKSCLAQELSWFEGVDSGGGGGSSLNALVDKYEDGIGMKLALLCYFLGHVALFTLTAFHQLAQMASFCMPFVLLVGLVIYYLSEWQAVAIGEQSVFGKRSLQLAEEILAAIRTVFTFNGQHKELTRYSSSLAPFYRRSIIRHLYTALNTSISKFSIFACFACYCFYARRLFPPHSAEAPSNQAAVLAVMRGAEVSIVNILISIPFMEALQQARGSIARIYAAIERRSRISDFRQQGEQQQQQRRANKRPDRCEPSISFRSVQFSYTAGIGKCSDTTAAKPAAGTTNSQIDAVAAKRTLTSSEGADAPQQPTNTCTVACNRRKRVLDQFSLDIKAGQSVALVGSSGSGKSTVLALIQRLYDIDAGQLLMGGLHDIRELSVAWLRNQIAFVSQEPSLFDMSIEENIQLGLSSDSDEPPDRQTPLLDSREVRQQVMDAARAAGAHEFIARLPEGYATRVGSAGVQLSGGQKQRIAIARALIRKPKILLLDEPTSALDTESEAQVQEALRVASAGRTTITVAHRLSTVQDADVIVVMSDGQVVEKGTHDELMSRPNSLYQRLYAEQQAQVQVGEDADADEEDASSDEEDSSCSSSVDSEHDIGPPEDRPEKQTVREAQVSNEEGRVKLSFVEFWRFCGIPRWGSIASSLVCFLAGLILPFHLIAHSYLFAAFAFDEPEDIGNRLNSFGLLILSCSGVVFVISFLEIILPGYVGEQMALRLRSKTMEALLRKPMFYFDAKANSAGSLCDRFNGHICSLQSIAGARVATMLEALATLSVGAVYGCGQNLRLSMFCLGFALLVLVTTIIESRIMQLESTLQQRFDTQLAHLMADSLSNMRTIASLNKETFFTNKFAEIIRQREIGVGRPLLWLRTFLTSLKFVMPAMSWSASMYYGCHLLVQGSIDLQTIFIICPVVLFAVNDTFRALVFLPELLRARKSLESLHKMNTECAEPVKESDQSHTFAGIATGNNKWLLASQQARGQICFQNVHFAYPSRPSARVLDGLSLSVEPGESVALVGASGSGKSSCVNLLEKLYEYQAGEIRLDGRDLLNLDTTWVRSQIGLVSQEPTLLSYTIGDNIRYGDNSRFVSLNEVIEAAKTANIHDFIMSLPDRYDTQLLGSNHTAGCQLSGGQRQRLAIARALVRRAPILIFDEATSALDAHNETQVQEALDRARVGRTSLSIAHRLACVRQADKIAVLSEGRLVELGKHDELMQLANGHYRRLWKRQHQRAKKAQLCNDTKNT